MALTQQQLAELAVWVDQYAAQTDALSAQTAAAIMAAYAGQNFYSAAAAAEVARQAADLSNASEQIAAGLAAQYLAFVLAGTVGSTVPVPNLPLPPIRNGVPMTQVFERPMKLYRRKVSEGVPADRAWEQAMRLAATLADGNIRLAQRDQSNNLMVRLAPILGITGYRRVTHPEESETGTCGLCIVASAVIYSVGTRMPLHNACKCTVAPIVGDVDPGSSLNNLKLGDLYGPASELPGARRSSGTSADDLRRLRVKVNEHGEWGPVLSVEGHHFLGPDELAPAAA